MSSLTAIMIHPTEEKAAKPININSSLEELSYVFSLAAIDSVKAIFLENAVQLFPWKTVSQLREQFECMVILGSSSQEYSAIQCIGIQRNALGHFLRTNKFSTGMAADILGELANTNCALLNDSESFLSIFGNLTQDVPVFFQNGNCFIPFCPGSQGYLYVNTYWIYFGYSICRNRRSRGKSTCRDNRG